MKPLYKYVLLFIFGSVILPAHGAEETPGTECVPVGKVLLPATNSWTTNVALLNELSDEQVVLLGEHHDNSEHHRWQLQMIIGLHALSPDLILGFEMFPRKVQPVLDRWVAGELSEEEFLTQVQWSEYWTFDSSLYLPMFHYARMNHIPMYALNVERSLIRKVGVNGWDQVDEIYREGVSKPQPASQGYKEMLAAVFMSHGNKHGSVEKQGEEVAAVLADPGFNRFVESQSVWDRAMAEGVHAGISEHKGAKMVAVMGSGHMMYHFGVPEQIQALGMKKPAVLIPWDSEFECSYIDKNFADAVIGLRVTRHSELKEKERPRLGIYLEKGDGGVLIKKVLPGSLAEKSGLKENDLIVEIAGRVVVEVEEIMESVKSMQPGTWLPIRVKRSDKPVVDVVAKFPNK